MAVKKSVITCQFAENHCMGLSGVEMYLNGGSGLRETPQIIKCKSDTEICTKYSPKTHCFYRLRWHLLVET